MAESLIAHLELSLPPPMVLKIPEVEVVLILELAAAEVVRLRVLQFLEI